MQGCLGVLECKWDARVFRGSGVQGVFRGSGVQGYLGVRVYRVKCVIVLGYEGISSRGRGY